MQVLVSGGKGDLGASTGASPAAGELRGPGRHAPTPDAGPGTSTSPLRSPSYTTNRYASIVGIDDQAFPYYRAKLARELRLRAGRDP